MRMYELAPRIFSASLEAVRDKKSQTLELKLEELYNLQSQ
jgi:hypothetical protein